MNEITQEEIDRMQEDLIKTPIDHRYDDEIEYLDCDVPLEQIATRCAYEVLKKIGKLPQGIAWIEEELKRNS